jgi:threonine dehydratase
MLLLDPQETMPKELLWPAMLLGLDATIVMPSDAPVIKVEATLQYGAEIIFYDRYTENREQIAKALAEQSHAYLIPAYDHEDVIVGQSSIGIEAIQQMQLIDLAIDNFICPVGGGGLVAGSALLLNRCHKKLQFMG